jgi:uncharacterized protein (DUF1501 family)
MNLRDWIYARSTKPTLGRREWLRMSAAGLAACSSSGWIEALAADAAGDPARRRSCILLWMSGGPSQLDTFDPKPDHANGGPIRPIETSVPGIHIGQHLSRVARKMEHMAVIRSMSTKEGDHARATFLLRTGYAPQGPIHYPTLGSLVAKELGSEDDELPGFVSIAPNRLLSPGAFGPGFLGTEYAPLVVGETVPGVVTRPGESGASALKVGDLERPAGVSPEQGDARLGLLDDLTREFLAVRRSSASLSHLSAYARAVRLMRSRAARAFNLDDEPAALRDAYGRGAFGQGCLLARRLVERGVPFVEVALSRAEGATGVSWDTHQQNFASVQKLCGVLDPAWATLIEDLQARGLLDTTLVVWMGEFGRTPKINNNAGRDHFPAAWTTVLGGGGIKGGQVIGRTSADGNSVEERPVAVPDLMATICKALGIDPSKQNLSDVGRPIRIADPSARPITEALA